MKRRAYQDSFTRSVEPVKRPRVIKNVPKLLGGGDGGNDEGGDIAGLPDKSGAHGVPSNSSQPGTQCNTNSRQQASPTPFLEIDGSKLEFILNEWPGPELKSTLANGMPNRFFANLKVKSQKLRGVKCYRRAMLQALMHIPCLLNFLLIAGQYCKIRHGYQVACHICRMRDVARAVWSTSKAYSDRLIDEFDHWIATHHCMEDDDEEVAKLEDKAEAAKKANALELVELARYDCKWMAGGTQEDAVQFLEWITDLLIKDPQHDITASAMFQSELAVEFTCPHCQKRCRRENARRTTLILDTDQDYGEDFSRYLNHFFHEEAITNGKCTNADCKFSERFQNVKQNQKLLRAPQILFIQLQRHSKGEKQRKFIRYPRELDLTQFTKTGFQGEAKYTLSSVVRHEGETIQSGHYTAYTVGREGQVMYYDDDYREAVAEERLLAVDEDSDAYILTYLGSDIVAAPQYTTKAPPPSPGPRTPSPRPTPKSPSPQALQSPVQPNFGTDQDIANTIEASLTDNNTAPAVQTSAKPQDGADKNVANTAEALATGKDTMSTAQASAQPNTAAGQNTANTVEAPVSNTGTTSAAPAASGSNRKTAANRKAAQPSRSRNLRPRDPVTGKFKKRGDSPASEQVASGSKNKVNKVTKPATRSKKGAAATKGESEPENDGQGKAKSNKGKAGTKSRPNGRKGKKE
ncbi:MAG: hypothetical protein Q9159_003301 [Coniocarpon cinnabarinum]